MENRHIAEDLDIRRKRYAWVDENRFLQAASDFPQLIELRIIEVQSNSRVGGVGEAVDHGAHKAVFLDTTFQLLGCPDAAVCRQCREGEESVRVPLAVVLVHELVR